MDDYAAPDWRPIFAANGLTTFQDFWDREIAWFEEPNQRRGGWSGVGRCELTMPDGSRAAVFVKRQENHATRTWRHPIRGVATLIPECRFLRLLGQAPGPPLVPKPLYFGHQREGGAERAVLVVEELAGFSSLRELAARWSQEGFPKSNRWIEASARAVRAMHDLGVRHNSLHGKHLFLKPKGEDFEARVIDLEKAGRIWRRRSAALRDLDTLHRRSPGVRRVHCLRFLKRYLGEENRGQLRGLWKRLAKKAQAKARS